MEILTLENLVIFTLLSLSFYLINFLTKPKPSKTGGFKIYPLVGTLPSFLRNRHRFLDWSTDVLSQCPTNTSVFSRPGNIHGLITANPLNVEHMLKTNFENYPKGGRFIARLGDFLGDGIFNSDGESWKVQRKTASYEFSTKSLRNFVMDTVTVELGERLLPVLERAAEERVLDLQDLLERFAFDNICKVAFNVDPGCLRGDVTAGTKFMKAFDDAATLSAERFMHAIPNSYRVKRFLNLGSEKRLRDSIAIVHEFADKIIRLRMEERTTKNDEDLLSRFISNHFNSPKFLRDIVISFILAGRDTTSAALSWFFWLLSLNPNVEIKILEELREIRERNGRRVGDAFTFEELREMQYIHAAISESMRLYPPVPVNSKDSEVDDVMPDGTFVGKGWFVSYNTYAMGRMESIWGKDCREFRPERWLDNGICKQESPFRYPVFHAGLRICLGKDMAFIQMKSIVASVMERFKIEVLEEGKNPEQLLSLTLRMKGGLPVRVKERSENVM